MKDELAKTKLSVLMSQPEKFFRWLGQRLLEILNIPIWLLSLLVPKDDRIWIFGAWMGEKYSDNPKWLYEYVNTNVSEVRAVWLSKNRAVIEELRQRGLEAYHMYSFKGYWFSARAKVGIVCVGTKEMNRFVKPPVLINTWHGTPIKKVGKEVLTFRAGSEKTLTRGFTNSLRRCWYKLIPYSDLTSEEKRYSLYTAGSKIEADLLRKSFGNISVKITGQPRNDVLCGSFDISTVRKSDKKQVLYLPPHRFEGKERIVSRIVNGIEKVDSALSEVNAEMIIKLHFYHGYEIEDLVDAIKGLSSIKVLYDDETLDIYPLLRMTDILITDYSSVYVDYLLTGRPIIFFPFDLEEYMSKERTFNFEYMSITPGPKCSDWESVALWIKRFCEDPSLYLEERVRLKSLFHAFDDGRNCERVVGAIKELLSERNMCDALDVYYTAISRNQAESHRCQRSGKPKQK